MLVGFKAQNHRQQVAKRGASEQVDDRGTDPEFFAQLSERFGGFDLDVAAAPHNAKCERFYTLEDDGLAQPWHGRVWCNPPYSGLDRWVQKAWREWNRGHEYSAAAPHITGPKCPTELIVMLLPANRCEQGWWQDHVEPYRDRGRGLRTEFMRGRLRFIKAGATEIKPNERPPFGCVLLIWAA